MARWPETLILLLHSALLASFSQADVQCRCTTNECQTEGEDVCTAQYFCYVQYMPVTYEARPDTPLIIRGCIDERTPILCENRRPQTYTGPWPVLLCCKEDGCNQDVIPTIPPWVDDVEGQAHEEQRQRNRQTSPRVSPEEQYNTDTDEKVEEETEEEEDVSDFSHEETPDVVESPISDDTHNSLTSSSSSSSEINPLYIGVPVAGACILLAIIIFAIYILRRQNQYMDEYHYHENLKQHQQHHHYHHPHQHPCVVGQSRTAYPIRAMTTSRGGVVVGGDPGRKTPVPYPDCERSSSGSETKLLMKV